MANENQIILALVLAHLSPADQLSALKKILDDSYVLKKANDLAIREHIIAAINSLLPIEKAALISRLAN